MATAGTHYLARAYIDADLRMVEADEPLLALQEACGGFLGDTVSIPELLVLISKARSYGLKLARPFTAIDGARRITAWVEIMPEPGEVSGPRACEVAVVSWHSEDLPPENDQDAIRRRTEINRHLAECSARLDPQQNLLSIETDAPDLIELASKALLGAGKPWTDFVRLPANMIAHQLPLHWRLMDGVRCEISGSRRQWTAHLEPLGQRDPGSAGFVLYLTSDTPLGPIGDNADAMSAPSLGRHLTPVLRQPINSIIANAETIRTKLAGPLDDKYSECASDIATAGQHLLALIDDLSDLEVVESNEFVTAPDRIELADVARRACGILSVRAREKNIALVPPPEGEGQLAIAEFRRALQILLNIVGNAIRYSPEGSQVWVRLDRIGSRALVTVADQGHGLSAEQQERVFEKFERLGRSGDGGSGLGLYISRRIARAMDGDLTVESAPGQGARFTLSVPAATDLREMDR